MQRIKTTRWTLVTLFTVSTVCMGAGGAWAADEPAKPAAAAAAAKPADKADTVVYKKRTLIDLSGAVIEGELTKPEGSYIVNRKVSQFSSLIKLRENFLPELMASPDML